MKKELYLKIVRKRQKSAYAGYHNIADFHNGFYECDHVSPYSLGACNLNAKVMYFLQDWAGSDWMQGPINEDSAKFGCSPKFPTNRNIEKWLSGFFGLKKEETFGTNVFPFIKEGSMSSGLKHKDVARAAVDFAIPTIEVVKPQVVIAFGLKTYNGLRAALKLKPVVRLEEAINTPFEALGAKFFCLAHPGVLGTNSRNRKNKNQVALDWQKVAYSLV
jgi:uracil-DNA glycosylase